MIPEVEASLQRVLARVGTSALVRDDRAELRCATSDEVELAAEVRRLRDLLPHFARLASFAAWVEDAKKTELEVKRLKATLADQATVLRGVLDENAVLRDRSEQVPSYSTAAVDALLSALDSLETSADGPGLRELDVASARVRASREPKVMNGPTLEDMPVEDALPYADDVVSRWPHGFSQRDRAALKALAAEVRRIRGLRDVEALIAERDQLHGALQKLDAQIAFQRETIRIMSTNEGKLHLRIAQLETALGKEHCDAKR